MTPCIFRLYLRNFEIYSLWWKADRCFIFKKVIAALQKQMLYLPDVPVDVPGSFGGALVGVGVGVEVGSGFAVV